jgi:hypothetical protein
MHKIRFLPTKGKVCGAIFDRKYKQFDANDTTYSFISKFTLDAPA